MLEQQLSDEGQDNKEPIVFEQEVRVGDYVYVGDRIFQYHPDITYHDKIECFERWEVKRDKASRGGDEKGELSRKTLHSDATHAWFEAKIKSVLS